ncbi:hypothetical protein EC957_001157 [Mortierella hygrophila]|uniref:Guanine nucleotide-binding protein subunit gamma n=1 Tax=Mortierella hygrophila TaxID=979708 RepID=A0A9P6K7N7_9FUNG|nr:hypothetical protein EC957_001157 [Mortierella hygrophila]
MSSPTITTSPMATPNLGGHSNLFNSSATDNSSGSVLRSPSLNSAKGGSTSSATTANSSTLTGNGSGTTVAGSVTGLSGIGGMSGISSSGVSDIKLKRFLEHNQRLQEQLEMRRISVTEASQSLIKFVMGTKDLLIPTLWGNPPSDPFSKQATGCCTIS